MAAMDKVSSTLAAELTRFSEYSRLPAFGPALSNAEPEVVVDALVVHRLLKGFEKPEMDRAKQRRSDSIKACLKHDESRSIAFDCGLTPAMKHARKKLWELGNAVKRTYRFRAPSGESATSTHGFVDLAFRLADAESWEVSPCNLTAACRIAYGHATLKRAVKDAFKNHVRSLGLSPAIAYARIRSRVRNEFWDVGPQPLDRMKQCLRSFGWRCFLLQFKSVVRVNSTARITTVPKDNTQDRVITMAPFWDMVVQLSYMLDMRDAFLKVSGFDLDTLADVHKSRILEKCATIDLRNASNSVWWTVVRRLFHPDMVTVLGRLRNQVWEFDGEFYPTNMYAPMGNGTTFDVMTWLLWSLGHYYDEKCSVFGDDIIISPGKAELFCEELAKLGLEVNSSKSFLSGSFRESCGGFVHDSIGHIRSYELKWPTDNHGLFILANKLKSLIVTRQTSRILRRLLIRCWFMVIDQCPRDSVFWTRCDGSLPEQADSYASHLLRRWPQMGSKSQEIAKMIEIYWQRPLRLGVRYLRQQRFLTLHPEYAYRLSLRNGTKHRAGRKDTFTTRRTVCETEGLTPLVDIPLVSVIT